MSDIRPDDQDDDALPEHDPVELERWLREEVVPIAIAVEEDPSRLIPAEKVFADLRARFRIPKEPPKE